MQEALHALERLPLDEVPALAALPADSSIPVRHNPLFVGREERFKALVEALKAAEESGESTVAVTGIGGVGKSQLVSEFVHRYGQYFLGGVFWLNLADGAAVPSQIASCGGSGGMELRADFRHLPPDDQVKEVMSAWQSPLPRLLVFDNCEEEDLLERWHPTTGGCRVVLTSRKGRWNTRLGLRVVELDVLSREESVALLGKHRPDLPEDDPDLDAIAGELGDLPLALELAGSFLARYRRVVSPSNYLAQLQSPELLRHSSLRQAKGGISPIERERDVARTFAVSYERLDSEEPIDTLAVALLARAALFAPGVPILRELLVKTLGLPQEDPEAPLRVEDALLRLVELGMLQEQDADAQRMHRLVAAFVRSVVGDKEARPAVEQALLERADDLIERGYPQPLVPLVPHLRAATEAAKEREDERAASLCIELGRCLYMTGAYAEAHLYLEKALAIAEKTLGEEHPETVVRSLGNLALVLRAQGFYEEARPLFEWVLAIYEKFLGEDHLNTAARRNNLAGLLYDQGSYEEARSLYERSLAITEKTLGEEHPDTARNLGNLAMVLRAQGFYEEARPLFERALRIFKKVLGEEHPDTARSLGQLAGLLYDQGSYEEARSLYERSLAIKEKTLGEEHPDTASSLGNLAGVLYAQGSYEEARPYVERDLTIHKKVFGEEHPETARSLNNLASLLSDQGNDEEARPLFEKALAIYEKVLGKEHPNTEMVRQNLTDLDAQRRESRSGFLRRLFTRGRD